MLYSLTSHSLNTTTFHVIYGQAPSSLLSYGELKTSNVTLEQQFVERNEALNALKEQLNIAQERIKKYVDINCQKVEFVIKD